jgi:hypothetical protein
MTSEWIHGLTTRKSLESSRKKGEEPNVVEESTISLTR